MRYTSHCSRSGWVNRKWRKRQADSNYYTLAYVQYACQIQLCMPVALPFLCHCIATANHGHSYSRWEMGACFSLNFKHSEMVLGSKNTYVVQLLEASWKDTSIRTYARSQCLVGAYCSYATVSTATMPCCDAWFSHQNTSCSPPLCRVYMLTKSFSVPSPANLKAAQLSQPSLNAQKVSLPPTCLLLVMCW